MNLPPVRIGFAGYGNFAQFLHRSWSSLEGVEIVAAATRHHWAEDLRIYEHWNSLLTDKEVDLVAIATTPNLHAVIAEAMMQSGKHILIEKPVAIALGDANRLVETRDRTGRVAAVNFMMRFTPLLEILALWRHEQPFGRVRRVVIENHAQDVSLPPGHWFWDTAQSGGILVEHAVHFFDLVGSITNARPVRTDGWSHQRSVAIQDRVFATVFYDDGLVATQYHTFSRPEFFERTTTRLWFDLAEVELEGWFPTCGSIRALINAATEPALGMLPHFQESARRQVPGGSGSLGRKITVSGEPFSVTHEIEGSFDVSRPKDEVYADAVRAMLTDLRRAMADASHQLRVPLESGVEALRLALEATEGAAATDSRMSSQDSAGRVL
jgi:predicted dehydrogenase